MKNTANKNLDKLKKNLEGISGMSEVKLVDLMNSEFITKCSKYSSLEELFAASGFKIESKEDFAKIPDDEWDAFICTCTTHENWLEMQKVAAASYAKAALLKDLK